MRVEFFAVVSTGDAEYGVDAVAEYSPGSPPPFCMDPSHPDYADPGSDPDFELLSATVVEYPDLDDPHAPTEGRIPIGEDLSSHLDPDDVAGLMDAAHEAWVAADEDDADRAAEDRLDLIREGGW